VRRELGEDAQVLERDSGLIGRGRAVLGLAHGGLDAPEVAGAVRVTGARVVHAHNVHPTLGWRALAAAREAGARVVLHLHQYRLVCAVGVCFTRGQDCTRCHGRNTLPGLIHNCRGSLPEAAAYALALSAWQRRLISQADRFVVPSAAAAERLRRLGAPIHAAHVVAPVIREFADAPATRDGGYALVVSRLAPEKGVEIAIEACRIAGVPLVIAGDGPERERLEERTAGADVRFAGRVEAAELEQLRRGAGVALVPSRSAETFGLAAAEAMAAGVPVAGSRIGALPELVPDDWLAPPGDAPALAERIVRLRDDAGAGAVAIERVRALCAPEVVAPALAAVYAD
jgi:glycosyltransferase involved in cell wall biosynthesis